MKLMRYGAKGAEKPGLLDAQGQVRDLSGELVDITAHTLTPHGLQRLREINLASLPAVAIRSMPRRRRISPSAVA